MNGVADTTSFKILNCAAFPVFDGTVLALGFALLVLRGPALIVTPLGLANSPQSGLDSELDYKPPVPGSVNSTEPP
jgi:hypothetical protein